MLQQTLETAATADDSETLNATADESSTSGESAASEAGDAKQDTAEESSTTATTPDAKPKQADPSPARGAKEPEPKSMADVVEATLAKLNGQAEESPTPKTADPVPDSKPADGEAKDEPAKQPAVTEDEKKDADTVPFHKHPRWQALVKREQELAPKAQVTDELVSLTGGQEGFNNMQTLVRMYAKEPANAVPLLEQLLADAKARGGLSLTSKDLQTKVEDGLLDEQSALEIEQSRRMREHESQSRAAEQTAKRAETMQQAVKSLNEWEQVTRAKDPDYAALAEDVQDRLVRLVSLTPPQSAEEALKLAQQAYRDVKTRNASRMPKPAAVKPTLNDGSSRTAKFAPKTMLDVVSAKLRGE